MNKSKDLINEIEILRKQLHKVIDLSGGDLLADEVLEISQKLDQLLIDFIKKEDKTK